MTAAHVSVHYYVGFSYLMLQRYSDAIYHLSRGYLFYAGPKRGRSVTAGGDAIAKQVDRMLALLAVAHALSPTKWEDSREVREAREALRASEKYNEQVETMSRGGEAALPIFEELFKYGSPKTISPHSPPYHDAASLYNYPDAFQNTLSIFLGDIKSIINVPDLRTLLKLYTSIGAKKLATLAGKDEEQLLRELMVLKGSMKSVTWTETSDKNSTLGLLNGEETVVGNLGFSVNNETIGITEHRRTRQFTGRFLSQGLAAKQTLDQRASLLSFAGHCTLLQKLIRQICSVKARPLPNAVYSGSVSTTTASQPLESGSANRPIFKAQQNGIMQGKSVAWAASKA